jgi:cysteine-rich repeat protein
MLGGETGKPALYLSLWTDGQEDIVVDSMDIQSIAPEKRSIDRISIYNDQNTLLGDATVAACGATAAVNDLFCVTFDTGALVVSKTNTGYLVLRPVIKTDTDGGVSGDIVRLAIPGDQPTRTTGFNTYAIRAHGVDTNNPLKANNQNFGANGEVFIGVGGPQPNLDIDGFESMVVMSKILSVYNANPDADGTAIPTGAYTIARYTFSGAANVNTHNGLNDFVLHDIIFTVNAENVELDGASFVFQNVADTNVSAPCSAYNESFVAQAGAVTGTIYVRCDDITASAVQTAVDSGTEQTFALRGTVTNSQINASNAAALQVTLEKLRELGAVYGFTGSHVRWVDTDAVTAQEIIWLDVTDQVLSTYYSTSGPVCGNSTREGGETCDDGNTTSGDGCSATCTVEAGYSCTNASPNVCDLCGNGTRGGTETCDDGDTDSGDGCSATCAVEAGYSCNNNTPNVCDLCGNGTRAGLENCDDGNTVSGDGCSATCGSEIGYSCDTSVSPNICMLNCVDIDGLNIASPSEVITWAVVHNYDKCDANPLAEYLIHEKACISGSLEDYVTFCPVGTTCQENGQNVAACVSGGPAPSGNELNCTDSDNGFDIFTAGSTTNTTLGQSDADICVDTNRMQETYCERQNGSVAHLTVNCPAGHHCLNAACVAD